MRHRRKYRLPARRHSPWNAFRWLLALFIAALLAAGWWFKTNIHQLTVPLRAAAPPKSKTVLPRLVIIVPPSPAPPTIAAERSPSPGEYPRPARTVLESQLALEAAYLSPGSIDGNNGPQTQAAVRALQQKEKLPVTGELDPATKAHLLIRSAPLGTYTITTNDVARLQPIGTNWHARSLQAALDFETILELVAEKNHAHPGLIRDLNPDVNWSNAIAGTTVKVPNVVLTPPTVKAMFARISLSEKNLELFDNQTNLLGHFPCSTAQRVEKRPVGELHVATMAPNPNYTLDPGVFPESPDAQQLKAKLILPPGPNNPVGTVWIGLDRPGYGIHGTPNPEQVGRTESHGCFRLANWNVESLLKFVWIGMPVYVVP